jgi:hypothetical protein
LPGAATLIDGPALVRQIQSVQNRCPINFQIHYHLGAFVSLAAAFGPLSHLKLPNDVFPDASIGLMCFCKILPFYTENISNLTSYLLWFLENIAISHLFDDYLTF